eukprot:CAMPEP_0197244106 /NCGR_PEP_ID=MMETSP1429-20130617/9336_1 /TAXON_ID=49237 /ORGANISM="Chaetoceros  sp., Strain UNC1202" /LENGTH=117 /DNA_ID=CAMNT_0042704415 /DNA_START=168 /DNA_END=518 /DNA_ORIENTATION=-
MIPVDLNSENVAPVAYLEEPKMEDVLKSQDGDDEQLQLPHEPSNGWETIKNLVFNAKLKSSMTDQEHAFLEMINTCKSERTRVDASTCKFAHVVEAAIARARLRSELEERLSKLTSK